MTFAIISLIIIIGITSAAFFLSRKKYSRLKSSGFAFLAYVISSFITGQAYTSMAAGERGFPDTSTYLKADELGLGESYSKYQAHLEDERKKEEEKARLAKVAAEKARLKAIEDAKVLAISRGSLVCTELPDAFRAHTLQQASPYALQMRMPATCFFVEHNYDPQIVKYSPTPYPPIVQFSLPEGMIGYTSSSNITKTLLDKDKKRFGVE